MRIKFMKVTKLATYHEQFPRAATIAIERALDTANIITAPLTQNTLRTKPKISTKPQSFT